MSSNKSAIRQVRRAYRQDELARICTLPEAGFGRAFGMETITTESPYARYSRNPGQPEDYYHFRDNGSRVLAVAHLDTVVRPDRRTAHFRKTVKGPLVTSGALDDRLGAYVILALLPRLGITCDWLLTVGEESCASTAAYFTAAKDYDWMIEFDRGGTDVVMYQYEDEASRDAVEACGARMGHGSFSDVAALEQLGIKGFNWGVGYQGDYHSERGYAYLNDTFAMVAKYQQFSEQNAGITMPHDPDYREAARSGGRRHWWEDIRADEEYRGHCWECGEDDTVDYVTMYCTECGRCQDCGGVGPDVAAAWADPDQDDTDICQCCTPERSRRETLAEAMDRDSRLDDSKHWTGMTWDEYVTQRDAREALAAGQSDDRRALIAAYKDAIERDGDPASTTQDTALSILSARTNSTAG